MNSCINCLSDAQTTVRAPSYEYVTRSGSWSWLTPRFHRQVKFGLIGQGRLSAMSTPSKTGIWNKKRTERWCLLHLYPYLVVSVLLMSKRCMLILVRTCGPFGPGILSVHFRRGGMSAGESQEISIPNGVICHPSLPFLLGPRVLWPAIEAYCGLSPTILLLPTCRCPSPPPLTHFYLFFFPYSGTSPECLPLYALPLILFELLGRHDERRKINNIPPNNLLKLTSATNKMITICNQKWIGNDLS